MHQIGDGERGKESQIPPKKFKKYKNVLKKDSFEAS